VFLYLSDLGLAIPLSGGGHRQKYPEVDVNTARSRYNPVQLRREKGRLSGSEATPDEVLRFCLLLVRDQGLGGL